MPLLFEPFTLRSTTFKNRLFLSPMCQYSSTDGAPSDWHVVHLGARAVGGFSCIIQEATAVVPDGRISPQDAGIWNDAQASAYKPINAFIKSQGAVPAIQLAHAGRKASTSSPWLGRGTVEKADGGWDVVGPSPLAFDSHSLVPHALSIAAIKSLKQAFVDAAKRSLVAGFEIVEIHAAHGYLFHEFLSPLSNQRDDDYGGSLENRSRFLIETVQAVRAVWPDDMPLFVRVSASDWVENGWTIEECVSLCKVLKINGVDLIDVSSGGNVPKAPIPNTPGYQVGFAHQIKHQAGIAVGAVGLITSARQAEEILHKQQADVILLGREALRDPYFPLNAAKELGHDIVWPNQYLRAQL